VATRTTQPASSVAAAKASVTPAIEHLEFKGFSKVSIVTRRF
jgi:hypothetical protein